MTLPANEIICGDCLEVMKDWPDGNTAFATNPEFLEFVAEKD